MLSSFSKVGHNIQFYGHFQSMAKVLEMFSVKKIYYNYGVENALNNKISR